MQRPSLSAAAWLFFRIGNTTFGGGDPTIAALQREFSRRGWMDADQFSAAYGLARITPGTNMLAFCAAAGWFLRGNAGALAGVLAVTIPSAVLAVWLTHVLELGERLGFARTILAALLAAACGAMIAAAFRLIQSQLSRARWLRPALIAAGAFALARFAGFSPLPIIAAAALIGFLWPET